MRSIGAPPPSLAIRLLSRLSGATAVVVVLVGVLCLVAWWANMPVMSAPSRFNAPLPNTAVGLIAGGVALWLARSDRVPRWSIVASRIVAVAGVAWAVLFLVEWFVPVDLKIDRWLFGDHLTVVGGAPPGRLSITVAGTMLLLNVALLALHSDAPRAHRATRATTALALLITFTVVVTYMNGAREFYDVYAPAEMALATALGLMGLVIGVLFARPGARGGLAAILIDDAAGGVLARRLLPAAVLVPMVLGRVWLSGTAAGWYAPAGGASLFIVACTVVLVWAVARSARVVHAADAQRSRLLVREQMARQDAESANQAKGNFLAVMSHELRTPLSAIIGYEELLADEITGPINDGQRQQLSRIKASARHLLQLIDEILTFSRTEAGRETLDLEPVPVLAVVEEAVALVEPMATDKGVALAVAPAEPVPAMRTDPQKVRQILVNLLSNAVKFTDRGGAVSLGVTVIERSVMIAIRDSGIGIAAEHFERIFEPFWQVEQRATRTAGGTGLGLSVSRRLARMLGGDIDVDSAVGRGSTFTVTLPLDARSPLLVP